VLCREYWESLDKLVETIKPLVLAIAELEADRSIASVLNQWLSLEITYDPAPAGLKLV
jgi:CYTH domain-containing protein